MNPLVYHIVSGHAFFTGVALLIAAVLASTSSRPRFKRITPVAFFVGVIGIVVSSTALPYWLYAVAGLVTLTWFAARRKESRSRRASYVTIAVWLSVATAELPYHVMPSLAPTGVRSLTIIGDSVTAGIGGEETAVTWPAILAHEHELKVQDISHVGETAASALKRARAHSIDGSIVVIEIGGNDILGATTSSKFEHDLDALLEFVSASDRQIVMFELPLPPFFHEYGRAQRQLAAKHHVRLVPKRIFLTVIAGNGTTLDTIHLSQSGHRAMADSVWRMVGPALEITKRSSN